MEAVDHTGTMVTVEIVKAHSVFGDLIASARYCAAMVAVVLNASIAIAFLVQKLRRPAAVQVSPTGLLVLNLLVVDTFLGAISFLNVATNSIIMASDTVWCGARLGLTYLATISSHVGLLNVVIDRYLAIAHSLKYRDWMTWRRAVAMLGLGWFIPVAGALVVGLVAADDLYSVGTMARCSEIYASMSFVRYIWIPTHFSANLCVILIQWRVYVYLKQRDNEKLPSNQDHNVSDKSAWILFRITTPTYIAMLLIDVVRVVMMVHFTELVLRVYQVTLLLVQIVFLMNPVIYSYATANIRQPVSDLYSDVKKWLCPSTKVSKSVSQEELKAEWIIPIDKELPS